MVIESATRQYLNVKFNRNNMIKKIDQGLKNKNIKVEKNVEVEEFQKGFLENWDNLDNFPPAAADLKGLEGKAKKEKINQLKNQFAEWVSGEDAIAEGYSYAYAKKELLRAKIKNTAGNKIKKIRAAIKGLDDEK